MVVLEVTLPNGYKASNWGSQRLVKKKRGTTSLRAAQHLNGLMVFYFDYVSCLLFGLCALSSTPTMCIVLYLTVLVVFYNYMK